MSEKPSSLLDKEDTNSTNLLRRKLKEYISQLLNPSLGRGEMVIALKKIIDLVLNKKTSDRLFEELTDYEKLEFINIIFRHKDLNFYEKSIIISFIRMFAVECSNCGTTCMPCTSVWGGIIDLIKIQLLIREGADKLIIEHNPNYKDLLLKQISIIENGIMRKENVDPILLSEFKFRSAICHYWLNDLDNGNNLIDQLIQIDPNERKYKANRYFYNLIYRRKEIIKQHLKLRTVGNTTKSDLFKPIEADFYEIVDHVKFVYTELSKSIDVSKRSKFPLINLNESGEKLIISFVENLGTIRTCIDNAFEPYINILIINILGFFLNINLLNNNIGLVDSSKNRGVEFLFAKFKSLVDSNLTMLIDICKSAKGPEGAYLKYSLSLYLGDRVLLESITQKFEPINLLQRFNGYYDLYHGQSSPGVVSEIIQNIGLLFENVHIPGSAETLIELEKLEDPETYKTYIEHWNNKRTQKVSKLSSFVKTIENRLYGEKSNELRTPSIQIERAFKKISNDLFPYTDMQIINLKNNDSPYFELNYNTSLEEKSFIELIILIQSGSNKDDIWKFMKNNDNLRSSLTKINLDISRIDATSQDSIDNFIERLTSTLKGRQYIISTNPLIFRFNKKFYFQLDNNYFISLYLWDKVFMDYCIDLFKKENTVVKENFLKLFYIFEPNLNDSISGYEKKRAEKTIIRSIYYSLIEYSNVDGGGDIERKILLSKNILKGLDPDFKAKPNEISSVELLYAVYEYTKLKFPSKKFAETPNMDLLLSSIFFVLQNKYLKGLSTYLIGWFNFDKYRNNIDGTNKLSDFLPFVLEQQLTESQRKKMEKWGNSSVKFDKVDKLNLLDSIFKSFGSDGLSSTVKLSIEIQTVLLSEYIDNTMSPKLFKLLRKMTDEKDRKSLDSSLVKLSKMDTQDTSEVIKDTKRSILSLLYDETEDAIYDERGYLARNNAEGLLKNRVGNFWSNYSSIKAYGCIDAANRLSDGVTTLKKFKTGSFSEALNNLLLGYYKQQYILLQDVAKSVGFVK